MCIAISKMTERRKRIKQPEKTSIQKSIECMKSFMKDNRDIIDPVTQKNFENAMKMSQSADIEGHLNSVSARQDALSQALALKHERPEYSARKIARLTGLSVSTANRLFKGKAKLDGSGRGRPNSLSSGSEILAAMTWRDVLANNTKMTGFHWQKICLMLYLAENPHLKKDDIRNEETMFGKHYRRSLNMRLPKELRVHFRTRSSAETRRAVASTRENVYHGMMTLKKALEGLGGRTLINKYGEEYQEPPGKIASYRIVTLDEIQIWGEQKATDGRRTGASGVQKRKSIVQSYPHSSLAPAVSLDGSLLAATLMCADNPSSAVISLTGKGELAKHGFNVIHCSSGGSECDIVDERGDHLKGSYGLSLDHIMNEADEKYGRYTEFYNDNTKGCRNFKLILLVDGHCTHKQHPIKAALIERGWEVHYFCFVKNLYLETNLKLCDNKNSFCFYPLI